MDDIYSYMVDNDTDNDEWSLSKPKLDSPNLIPNIVPDSAMNIWNNMGSDSDIGNTNTDDMGIIRMLYAQEEFNEYMERISTMINQIIENCNKHNYEISHVTNMNGDCFFECLVHNNICLNVQNARKMTSYLMHTFKSTVNFISEHNNETLESLFEKYTESQSYHNVLNNKIEKYTYDVMCKDICNMGSWQRLPTQLIMMVLSKAYNIKFIIINSKKANIVEICNCPSNMPTTVNPIDISTNIPATETNANNTKSVKIREIGLGFFPELHYIGIKRKHSTENIDVTP